jgi:hypothetical protein
VKAGNATLSGYGTTIFEAMSALAREHSAVNLGQGFPDDKGPPALRAAAAEYVVDGHNQYPPMPGLPELRQAVAAHNQRFYGLDVNWQTEVLITSGATEALLDCFMGLLEAGDEVVMLEPAYDTYAPVIRRLGAVPRPVRLVPPAWSLPRAELAAAFSPRTKLLLLNSPMNPSGKVFTRDELTFLASLVEQHDAIAVSDEVYEHLVFGAARHIPLMTLPGMRERSVGRQDVLAHRLEGRLHHGTARAAAADHQGAPVRDVHDAAEPATRRGARARARRRVLPRPRAAARPQPRPAPGRPGLGPSACAAVRRNLLPRTRCYPLDARRRG